jgi:hypothetical protein
VHFPALSFPDRKVAVYFPEHGSRAIIITTWNPDNKTAAGVGPCSSLDDLRRAYGANVRPSPHATQKGKVWAYLVGKNLLFAVRPDTEVVATVALYDGGAPRATENNGTQSFANYVAQVEASCTV